jgi:catechol 2,3-dioxygenase-like lactoylglutathione lyase family enzyme
MSAVVAALVLYVLDPERVGAFYRSVTGLEQVGASGDALILANSSAELVLVRIPERIASGMELADPPDRRESTPMKPVFLVRSLAAARAAADGTGGAVDPPEREWDFRDTRVCDGYDPEGNVVQLRAPLPAR